MPDYDNQGRGFPLRWIIALAIAGMGLWTYFSQSQVNPVTGEKQHVAMTADQETAIGLQSAPEMAAQMGGEVSASDPREQLVKRIGQKVYINSDAQRSPYTYDFHLLNDSKTINAFALPGGQVFITVGLLDKLENEAQLAGVLGHEIGHVVNRHAAEHLAKSELGQKIAGSVGVAASRDMRHGMEAAAVAAVVNHMLQLKYSRNDESEADQFGLQYMTQAGYDPRAMLGVMKILMDVSRSGAQPELFQTHPQPEHRIERIQAYLDKTYPNGVPADLTMGQPLHHSVEAGYEDRAR
jgi:predicted Zn-dependent protease